MLIVATFKHSAYVELALKLLEQKGISRHRLLAAPLEPPPRDKMNELSLVHQNENSPYDLAFIFAMIFMLLGAIYGFVLTWGPVLWALIGIIAGGLFGLALDRFVAKKRPDKDTDSELVILLECDSQQASLVEEILWKHQARGISKVSNYTSLRKETPV